MANDDAMTEVFGEVISSYSRAQAIEDGMLVEIPEDLQKNAGYKYPIVFTSALWTEIERGLGGSLRNNIFGGVQDVQGRIWAVLWMSRAMKRAISESRVEFKVKIGRKIHKLWLDVGPGDDAEPVITVGFPEDF